MKHTSESKKWPALLCGAALLALAPRAHAQAPHAEHEPAEAYAPALADLLPAPLLQPALGAEPRIIGGRSALAVRQDRGREIPGLLWSTVGYVVPMPGTEMVRVGMIQEGATLQAANRNPSLEGFRREGMPQVKAATIHVIIRRPPQ